MLNQPFHAKQTITQFYRMDDYSEQIRSGINRLNGLLKAYRNGNKAVSDSIKAELQYLKAAYEEMESFLEEIRAAQVLQTEISGEMMELEKERKKASDMAEKILTS